MNKRYAICYNHSMQNSENVMLELSHILEANAVKAEVQDIDRLNSGYDFVFVIGGDGTILKAASFIRNLILLYLVLILEDLGFCHKRRAMI